MADWYKFNLVFIEPPVEGNLAAANKALQDEDYDAPVISAEGCTEALWRSPQLSEGKLIKLFNSYGLECKFQLHWNYEEDRFPGCHDWVYVSDFVEVKEKILKLSEKERASLRWWIEGNC